MRKKGTIKKFTFLDEPFALIEVFQYVSTKIFNYCYFYTFHALLKIAKKNQCCGSGMFIPDPGSGFFPIPDPGSNQTRGGNIFFLNLFNSLPTKYELGAHDLLVYGLREDDLREYDLHEYDLREYNLREYDIREYGRREYDLGEYDLREHDLHKYDLREYDLHKYDLREYDLRE